MSLPLRRDDAVVVDSVPPPAPAPAVPIEPPPQQQPVLDELFPCSQYVQQIPLVPDLASPVREAVPPPPPTLLHGNVSDSQSPQKHQQPQPLEPKTAAATDASLPTFKTPSPKKLHRLRRGTCRATPPILTTTDLSPTSTRCEGPGDTKMIDDDAECASHSPPPPPLIPSLLNHRSGRVEGTQSPDELEDDHEESTSSFIVPNEDMVVSSSEESGEPVNERSLHAQSLLSQKSLRPAGFDTPLKARPGRFKLVYADKKKTPEAEAAAVEEAAQQRRKAMQRQQSKSSTLLPFVIADADFAATLRDAATLRVVACPIALPCNAVYGTAAVPSCVLRLRQQKHSEEEVAALLERCGQLVSKYARVLLVLERSPGSESFPWDQRLRKTKGVRVIETASAAETARQLEGVVASAPEVRSAPAADLLPELSEQSLAEAQAKVEHLLAEVPRITVHEAVAIALAFGGSLQEIHDSSAETIEQRARVSAATAIAVYDGLHPQLAFDIFSPE